MYAIRFVRALHKVPNNVPLRPDTNTSAKKIIKFITPEKLGLDGGNDVTNGTNGGLKGSVSKRGASDNAKSSIPRARVDRRPEWAKHKEAVKKSIKGERWNPTKKLSKTEMEGVRLLKRHNPDITSSELAAQFKVSPEAIRRILKSKWVPTEEEEERIQKRWKRRGERIRKMYIENPDFDTDDRIGRKLNLSYDSRQKSMEITSIQRRIQAQTHRTGNTYNGKSKNKLHLLKKLIEKDQTSSPK